MPNDEKRPFGLSEKNRELLERFASQKGMDPEEFLEKAINSWLDLHEEVDAYITRLETEFKNVVSHPAETPDEDPF